MKKYQFLKFFVLCNKNDNFEWFLMKKGLRTLKVKKELCNVLLIRQIEEEGRFILKTNMYKESIENDSTI